VGEDEVSFGPRREARPPWRRHRAFGVTFAVAGAAACVWVAVTVSGAATGTGAQPATASPVRGGQASGQTLNGSAGLPVPVIGLPSAGCAPAQTAWPDLARLPAGLRTAARPVIIDEQFSGRCPGR